jgi:predicted phosphate transport protein (TIGR00153 family)
MSSLMDWFKSRNEENAINMTLVHTQKVLECVVEFNKGLSFFLEEKNIDLALKVFFRVDELEHQADGIRRNILNMLSQAELPSKIRENLTHLVKRIDDIANAANASSRILISMNHKDFMDLGDDVHKNIVDISRISVEAVKKVNLMVDHLMKAKETDIQSLGVEVNKLEHQCDEKHYAINRSLVSNNLQINPFSAIVILNCISALEAISDNAEDVADYIIMLTLAKRLK